MRSGAKPSGWERQPDPADAWSLPEPARSLLRDDRNVVPVLGAGMSRSSGLPLAWQLAEWLADNLDTFDGQRIADDRKFDLGFVADHIVGPAYGPDSTTRSDALRRTVAEHLSSFVPQPNTKTWALTRIASKFII